MKTTWISAHLFFTGQLNVVLNELVSPFLDAYQYLLVPTVSFFFIRYPEGGDHIRLRLHTTQPVAIIQALDQNAARFYNNFTGPNNYLSYKLYEPEINRYGDHTSITWAEEHFFLSSHIILDWIKTKNATASLQIKAIELHLQLLTATGWPLPALIELCNHFITEWLTIFQPKWNGQQVSNDIFLASFERALAPQQALLFPVLTAYWEELQIPSFQNDYLRAHAVIMDAYNNAGFSYTQLTSIISSMLHMTHNRIGIRNNEEAYIMYCLKTFLSHIKTRHE